MTVSLNQESSVCVLYSIGPQTVCSRTTALFWLLFCLVCVPLFYMSCSALNLNFSSYSGSNLSRDSSKVAMCASLYDAVCSRSVSDWSLYSPLSLEARLGFNLLPRVSWSATCKLSWSKASWFLYCFRTFFTSLDFCQLFTSSLSSKPSYYSKNWRVKRGTLRTFFKLTTSLVWSSSLSLSLSMVTWFKSVSIFP